MTRSAAAATHGLPAAAVQQIQATLYGSRALGRHRPGSDIDLTLAGDALDDLLLPWRFDLSLQASLQSPELIDHIQRVGQVFYRRSPWPDFTTT
ncbi:nucleotidyltransferase domain-containing protein [Synechococcus sp. CS-205]|uniref:nucleotidyltransferase domain-containing protein n=1 Tax=Synechococcus sp. CS-205 TaxID=2847984 RepID=UPI00223B6C81|nr:nucleotidyltransferase domain-containing protein [Synechococcus sp. CS-205]